MEEAGAGNPPGLRIGEFFLAYQFKVLDIKWFGTPVLEAGTSLSPSAHEDPDVPFIIQIDTGIVMGVVDILLIMDDSRHRHMLLAMIVIRNHSQKMSLLPVSGATIDEKCFLNRWHIDRQRMVFGSVCAQATGIFRTILGVLAEVEPTRPPAHLRFRRQPPSSKALKCGKLTGRQ
jgi:hypothetical protein